MILELVDFSNPILTTPLEEFDFISADPIEIGQNLVDTLVAKGGIGLAANQCGLPHRVFVLWSSPPLVCFNPRIVDASEEEIALDEACLTYPGLVVKVSRPKAIRARFQMFNGDVVTRRFEGMSARVFQHEMDHLNGRVFCETVSRLRLEAAIKKAKKSAGKEYPIKFLLNRKK